VLLLSQPVNIAGLNGESFMLVAKLAKAIIKRGHLTLIDAHGKRHEIAGAEPGPRATVRLTDPKLHTTLALKPKMEFGEAYMDGKLILEDCDLSDLLSVLSGNARNMRDHWFFGPLHRFSVATRKFAQANSTRRARKNVAHHYDLSGELYDRFLDQDRFYSCAYFPEGDEDIEAAQDAKARHIAAKLLLEPGCSVLDIGSGWGSLGIRLARYGAGKVDGVTLSTEQHAYSNAWAERERLSDKAKFHLRDYRDVTDTYDRVVSVGMMEHVGVGFYKPYFEKVRDMMAPDGVALIHSIGRSGPPGFTNPWIQKYIFPGGYIPSLSEVLPVIEHTGLIVTDIEILRLHYGKTVRRWRERFHENWDEVAKLYDERFCRMWDYYLAGSIATFEAGGMMVFQIQLAKQHSAVPLTRDYITEAERELAKV